MFVGKPVIKCYARPVKQRGGVAKRENKKCIIFDPDSSNSILNSTNTKSTRKKKRKKHDDDCSKENQRRRFSFVSKPTGLKRATSKTTAVESKPIFCSIFNDSSPFEESPFSKMRNNMRNDIGLEFVKLDYFQPTTKCLSSSSGCVSNSRDSSGLVSPESPVTNVSREKLSFVASEKVHVRKGRGTVVKQNWGNELPASPSDSSVQTDSSNFPEEDARLSLDIIEGTPTPPSILFKAFNKVYRNKRRAMLLTSTPLRDVESLISLENSSPSASDDQRRKSKPLEDVLNLVSRTASLSLSPESNGENGVSKHVSSKDESAESVFDSFLAASKESVFCVCQQLESLDFSLYVNNRLPVTLEKIGEGVFSEVFGCLNEEGKRSVWKVQPFGGDMIFNGEEQKGSADILSEILITSSLSNLRNGISLMTDRFVECLDFKCVHGPFPKVLLECWRQYDEKKGSENDSPTMFDSTQLMLLTELEYAGVALEDFVFASAAQALSIFTQVAHALAVGELALEFEHRDLHWGNIMIFKTPDQHVSFVIDGERKTMDTKGVAAKIVDFTFSRATIDGRCLFVNLALCPDIFESTGEYQFDIYRLMRKHNKNEWSGFSPYTNILWLHYLVLQLCKAVKYRNKKTKIHKDFMKKMQLISSSILDYSSASEYVAAQKHYPLTVCSVNS